MEEKQWYFLPWVSKNKPETGAGTTSCQAPGYSFLGGERTKQLNSGEKQGSSVQEEKDWEEDLLLFKEKERTRQEEETNRKDNKDERDKYEKIWCEEAINQK